MEEPYTRQATDGVMLEASFVIRSMILEASANAWRQKYQQAFDLPGGTAK